MGVRMMDLLSGNLDTLRYEPTAKRVRVSVGGEPVADPCEARLGWEPRPVRPPRRPAEPPPRPHRAGRTAAGRIVAADAVVRDAAAGAVLSASRGRRRPARAQRHSDLLRIQRPGVLLLRARRAARCGVD